MNVISYTKQSTMKDSGVDWLGDIPSSWKVVKLRFIADITTGDKDTENNEPDGQYPFYVRSQTVERISSFSHDGEAILTAGDGVGVCKVWHYALGKFDFHQRVYMLYNFRDVDGRYLFHYIKNNFIHDVLKQSLKSTVDSLRRPMFLDFPVALPAMEDQKRIAAFLDHQTGLIDQLIEKNTKLLELLDVQRKAIINEAVTKGLDPKAPMKNSGVEWLGEVPRHWRPVKIKYLFEFQSGATPSTKNPAYWNGTIPWVSSKDMKTKYIERTEDYITEEGLANSSCSLIVPGSVIVVSRSGILQRTIPVAINRVPLVVNQDQKVLTPKGACSAEFFYHYVKGNEPILLNEWIKAGATVESIEIGAFMDHAVHIPPVAEQKEIVNHLIDRTKTMDEVRQRIEQQNVLLGDYRQSLISEAVTGKIDLREWAPAPQQTVEP